MPNLTTTIFLDIETLPGLWVPLEERGVQAHPPEKTVPKNFKDPAKVQAWKDRRFMEVQNFYLETPPDDSAWRKGSLDRFKGLTHVICWALESDPMDFVRTHQVYYDGPQPGDGEEAFREAEHDFLSGFEGALPSDAQYAQWVTFNGNHFDLPWLMLRALRYGLPHLGKSLPGDKWGKQSIDLAERVKFTDYRSFVPSAAKVAEFVMGIDPEAEDGSTGAGVLDNHLMGDHEKTIKHCQGDVRRLRALHRRMSAMGLA